MEVTGRAEAAPESTVPSRWRQTVRGGITGGAGRATTIVLSLAVTPIAITHAGSTTYGLFAALTAFTTLLAFADFGVANGVIREITGSRARSDTTAEGLTTATALGVLIVFGALITMVGAILAFTLPWRALLHGPTGSDNTLRHAVLLGTACMGLAVPAALAQKVYLARQRPVQANLWLNAAAALGSLGLLAAVLAGHHLPAMVAAQLGGPALVGLISLVWLAAKHGVVLDVRRASGAVARNLLRSGRLFAVLQLAAIITLEIDSLVVARLLGPRDVTQFVATGRLFAAPVAVAMLFFASLWAAFADAASIGDVAWLRQAYRRAATVSTTISVPIAVAMALGSQWIVTTWTRGSVHPQLSLVLAMSMWLVVYAVNQPQAMLLNGLHAGRFQVWAASANVAVNLSLSVVFTLAFGVSGPIWGSIVAQLTCAVIPSTIYLRRVLASSPGEPGTAIRELRSSS